MALLRPEDVSRSINITLRLEGNDGPTRWELQNASQLASRSPWLLLPMLEGEITVVGNNNERYAGPSASMSVRRLVHMYTCE